MAGPKKPMTNAHKEALAIGRAHGRSVRAYLEALDAGKPKRGRKRTLDSVKKRLAAVELELRSASPLQKLHLVQERIDLRADLAGFNGNAELTKLELEFTKVAAEYSASKGISYGAWRELGVSAEVLNKAGITRES